MVGTALVFFAMTTQEWKPVEGGLMTRWAKDVRASAPHSEYPRPSMVRRDWMSLNGLWEFAIAPATEQEMPDSQGKILVPFPVESALSGVKRPLRPDQTLWYRRTFEVPEGWSRRVLIHFDAVDWEAEVWLNGERLGSHRGGYDRFTFDLSQNLRPGENELVVAVKDPTDSGSQPRGKQVLNPEGIWYTAVSGIWQSVWIEPVGDAYLKSMRADADPTTGRVRLHLDMEGFRVGDEVQVRSVTPEGRLVEKTFAETTDTSFDVASPMPWSPKEPVLYEMVVRTVRDGKVLDQIESYYAFRKVELRDDKFGRRIYLNGEPLFMFGPLDQGWWPDGLNTAPTDDALKYDLEFAKKMGFNAVRKHVKVEPERWYYWCDVLGIAVWQDMPSGDRYIGGNDPDIERTKESGDQFETELSRLIEQKGFHPCIVMWVPYNEGWGQWDTSRIVSFVKRLDPTRLVDGASGWTDRGVGDVIDVHRYPGPAVPPPDGKRAQVLGEFGGLGLPLNGHLWWDKRNWGYRTFQSLEELRPAYERLIEQLDAMRASGLSAAVYTQTTDVEGEVNGLMTYDRAVMKIDPSWAAPLHARLYLPVPETEPVLPTSETVPQTWSYTFDAPDDDWYRESFDPSPWGMGQGGFGQSTTPAPHVGTEWTSSEIWIRRTFELSSVPSELLLRLWHDEDADVYINGKLVAALAQWVDAYVNVPFDASTLRVGRNTIAVHCKQTSGGQFIDVGIVRRVE